MEFRFNGDEVFIKKVGNVVVLIPTPHSWDSLFASLYKFSTDIMTERHHPRRNTAGHCPAARRQTPPQPGDGSRTNVQRKFSRTQPCI